MGIRNKTGKSDPPDASDSRHSLEESTKAAAARTKREQGRRLPFAHTKPARRLPQTEEEFDPDFDAACRAMVLNNDRTDAELHAQAPTTSITSLPEVGDPPAVPDPLRAAAARIDGGAALDVPEQTAAPISQPRVADEPLMPLAAAPAQSGSTPDETERDQAELLRLRDQLTEQRQQIESLTRTAGEHEREVSGLREALSRTENDAVSRTEMLMQSLHETEAQREAEVAELGSAAQRLSEAQRELSALRASISEIHARHEAAMTGLRSEHDARIAELQNSMSRREAETRNSLEALRRRLDNTEAQRKATAAELVAAAEREAEAERETLDLRKTISDLSNEHDAQIGELRALVSRREMEATALDQALLKRESEWADLHATMINRDIEALKLTEDLRRALLHSEAQREADAAALLEIMAQQAAAESAERANDMARKHLANT